MKDRNGNPLTRADIKPHADLERADLAGANLENADLDGATGVNLKGASGLS